MILISHTNLVLICEAERVLSSVHDRLWGDYKNNVIRNTNRKRGKVILSETEREEKGPAPITAPDINQGKLSRFARTINRVIHICFHGWETRP